MTTPPQPGKGSPEAAVGGSEATLPGLRANTLPRTDRSSPETDFVGPETARSKPLDDGSPEADFVSPEVAQSKAAATKSKARQAADSFSVPSAEPVADSATVATKEKSATLNCVLVEFEFRVQASD